MKESSRFYSSLGLLIVLNSIIKPVWIFLIDRQVQNTVGPEAYGIYFSLFNFSIVFSFLLDWGLTSFFNQQLASKPEMEKRLGDMLVTRVLFILLYLVVMGLVASFSGVDRWSLLWKIAGIQVLTSLFIFLRSIITAQQWFRTDAWLSILDKGLMILVCGSFLYMSVPGKIDIDIFLLVQLGCTAFAMACAGIILLNNKIKLFRIDKGFIGACLFKAALPFGIVVLLMSAHYRLDGFLLGRIFKDGAHETGLYAGAYRLLDAANMIGFLYASFLLPFIARRSGLKENIEEAVLNGRHLLMIFSVLITGTGVFLAPWVQQVLYHNNDATAISIMQWCLPALIGYSLVQVYGTVLTATGHIVSFCYIVLISLIINVTLNLSLIPEYGAKGCCIAALVSQLLCGIVTMLYASKKCRIRVHSRSLLMYIFIALIAGGSFYLCVNSGIPSSLQLLIVSMIVIASTFLTGLFKLSRGMQFFKQTNAK